MSGRESCRGRFLRAGDGSPAAPARGSCPSRRWPIPTPTPPGRTLRAEPPERRAGSGAVYSFAVSVSVVGAARERPFLYARQMIVVATAAAQEHRPLARAVRGVFLFEFKEHGGQAPQRF